MKRTSRSIGRLAAGMALIGAFTSVSWSQGVQESRSSVAEPALFANVNSYLQANIPALERSFLVSLDYPSEGVVESALREIIRVKLAQPTVSSKPIEEKLRELAEEGSTPTIRYKAILGLQVFENGRLFLGLAYQEFKTDDEMFTAISRQLEKSLLARNF